MELDGGPATIAGVTPPGQGPSLTFPLRATPSIRFCKVGYRAIANSPPLRAARPPENQRFITKSALNHRATLPLPPKLRRYNDLGSPTSSPSTLRWVGGGNSVPAPRTVSGVFTRHGIDDHGTSIS